MLEHVVGNWCKPLADLHSLLSTNGFLLLTVPWIDNVECGIEHYPDCINFEIEKIDEKFRAKIITSEGTFFFDEDPVFHGGPGNTLEMRIFSLPELVKSLKNAGFNDVTVRPLDNQLFGIGHLTEPGVIVAKS